MLVRPNYAGIHGELKRTNSTVPGSGGRHLASASTRQRHEHLFFSGIAVLLLATVFVGFAASYYLAGMVKAPLRREDGLRGVPADAIVRKVMVK